jgi:hypothetical protein
MPDVMPTRIAGNYMNVPKWVAAVAGALITGAVGSGIWDLALKPLVLLLWRTSGALGGGLLAGIQDTPYGEAASGSPHDSFLYLSMLLVAAWFGREWAGRYPAPWTIRTDALHEEERLVRRRRHRRVATPANARDLLLCELSDCASPTGLQDCRRLSAEHVSLGSTRGTQSCCWPAPSVCKDAHS